jgi:hypothetical protein
MRGRLIVVPWHYDKSNARIAMFSPAGGRARERLKLRRDAGIMPRSAWYQQE